MGQPTQKETDEVRATSARMNEYGAGLLQRLGYKEKEPLVVEEMTFFPISYYLDAGEPTGGRYHACYQKTWEPNRDEYWEVLVDMELVDGATVMEVIGKLMTVLGRPIKADEWELAYDERYEEE